MTKSQSKVTLYPPVLSVALSSKYKTVVNVKWGNFEQDIEIDREYPGFMEKMVREVSKVLLEASETTKPYLTYDRE